LKPCFEGYWRIYTKVDRQRDPEKYQVHEDRDATVRTLLDLAHCPQPSPPFPVSRYYGNGVDDFVSAVRTIKDPNASPELKKSLAEKFADRRVTEANGNVWYYQYGQNKPLLEEAGSCRVGP
jgi:hypothetical protein